MRSFPILANEEDAMEEDWPSSNLTQVIPEGGSVEPFGMCKVSLDNERYRVLQHFVLKMYPVSSRADTRTSSKSHVSRAHHGVAQLTRDCLTEEMHTYVLLTVSSSRMNILRGRRSRRLTW
jgi:hypothetical protein